MPTNPDILATQIQRLMLNDADKKRLLDELKSLDETSLQELSDMIRAHDEEALNLLNKKAQEQQELKKEFFPEQPASQTAQNSEQEEKKYVHLLHEVFSDPQKLAEFMAVAEEDFLVELERVFIDALKGQPKYQEEFHRFFREVRLQKASLEKQSQDAQKERLIDAIISTQTQNKALDEMIQKAEKAIGKG